MADKESQTKNSFDILRDNLTVGDVPDLVEADILMQWKAKEYRPLTLDRQYLTVIGIVGIALFVVSLVTANFLFTIILILLTVAIYLFLNREPRDMDVAITTKGVIYGDRFMSYTDELLRFWVLYEPPQLSTLNFAQSGLISPTLEIQLDETDPLEVRETLLDYLDEDLDAEEHSADRFSRRIGF